MSRNRIFVKASLLVLAALQGSLGIWAVAAPRGFYDDYPGLGRQWVSALPPYNEHLIRDVGSLSLALALATLAAALFTERRLVQIVALAWLAWSVPHIAYHATVTETASTSDNVLSFIGLALEVALPVALLFAARRLGTREPPPGHAGAAAGREPVAARPDQGA